MAAGTPAATGRVVYHLVVNGRKWSSPVQSHEALLQVIFKASKEAGREIPNMASGGFDHVFMIEAELAAKRAQMGGEHERGASAAAILCAAAACEAALSERLVHNIGFNGDRSYIPVRGIKNPSRRWHAFLKIAAPHFNAGGSKEYQALDCLFELRNHVAHRHARFLKPGVWPDSLAGFVSQGILPIEEHDAVDWMYLALTKAIALWASVTAQTWLKLIGKLAPYSC